MTSINVIAGLPGMRPLLVDGGHDINCRIDGIGAIKLKSEFVRNA